MEKQYMQWACVVPNLVTFKQFERFSVILQETKDLNDSHNNSKRGETKAYTWVIKDSWTF